MSLYWGWKKVDVSVPTKPSCSSALEDRLRKKGVYLFEIDLEAIAEANNLGYEIYYSWRGKTWRRTKWVTTPYSFVPLPAGIATVWAAHRGHHYFHPLPITYLGDGGVMREWEVDGTLLTKQDLISQGLAVAL